MMDEPRPFLMTDDDAVPIKEAARRARISAKTVVRLYREHRIGRQAKPRAPIEISYPALVILRHGDMEALELLREGYREHPSVSRYLRFIGTA